MILGERSALSPAVSRGLLIFGVVALAVRDVLRRRNMIARSGSRGRAAARRVPRLRVLTLLALPAGLRSSSHGRSSGRSTSSRTAPFLMLVTVLFAVLAVAPRAPAPQRVRPPARSDEGLPAACATLGLNTVQLKLSVFAAVGGHRRLRRCALRRAAPVGRPRRFILFLSLSLFMLTVVGGIGYVSGALFGGVLLAVSAVRDPRHVHEARQRLPVVRRHFDWLSELHDVAAGDHRHQPRQEPERRGQRHRPRLRAARPAQGRDRRRWWSLLVGVWFLAQQETSSATGGSWCCSPSIMVGVPRVAQSLKPEAFIDARAGLRPRTATPLELIGIDRRSPWPIAACSTGAGIGARTGIARSPSTRWRSRSASDQTIIDDIAGENEPGSVA